MKELNLDGILQRISTTVDGGWRIVFDIDQRQSDVVAVLGLLRDHLMKLTITIDDDESGAV